MVDFNIHASAAITGTPSATTYLRGDGTWNTPADTNTTYTANETNITLSGTEFRLKNKTSYWSCGGVDFAPSSTMGGTAGTDRAISTTEGAYYHDGAGGVQFCAVHLPHGAIITAVVVHGADAVETWKLQRRDYNLETGGTTLATAVFNTEDTTITTATVDNSTYCYFLETSSLDATDEIYGARITYTTDYI